MYFDYRIAKLRNKSEDTACASHLPNPIPKSPRSKMGVTVNLRIDLMQKQVNGLAIYCTVYTSVQCMTS